MPKPGYEEEKLDKRGSWDPNYVPPEDPGPFDPDPTVPRQWSPDGPISIKQPDGIWRPPDVYGKKKIVRFSVRPEIGIGSEGTTVKFGEFKKPFYRSMHLKPLPPEETGPIQDKYIDPTVPQPPDARTYTQRAPQYTVVPQKCPDWKPGPRTHNRLHKAVASGDKKHICRIVDPEGRLHRTKGGGWMCRKWTERPMPRDLVNHSEKEYEALLKAQAIRDAREEAEFQKLMKEVFGGMANEDGVMKDTHEMLTREKNCHTDKQAAMYKSWERQVYHNIQDQISDNLKKISPRHISNKLRYEQDRYAKAVGERRIFRDIINTAYDPFELSKSKEHTVHYSTKDMIDPIKHDLEKDKRERVFMGEPVFHKVHSKETLDSFYWTYDQFRTTMHGHINCDDEDATYKPREMIPEKWYSRPVFWNGEWRWLREYWNEAFPLGGKGMPPKPPDGLEGIWRIEKDMVWNSPLKNQRKLRISTENPWF
ncbi:hypothetical protein KC19_3G036600 [Ceratodon purpureus]|uniref:Uncharacterized protein n=1 Tax=Ceratodon purpureus TaxID=3225 RepID=A0A8T0IHV2_CERPU|nr:hypothetical protein KC19_3G036600 [Ceratodon purpureus]